MADVRTRRAPAAPMAGGDMLTSTQGDGFGDSPTPDLAPDLAQNPTGPLRALPGALVGAPAGVPAPLSPAPAAEFSPRNAPMTSTSVPTPSPTAPTPAAPGGGPTLTPTDPNNPLTAQTITPGSLADRFKLAQDRFATFASGTEPAYQSALRDANRMGAAQGRLGSGDLRTSFGDLALNRSRDLTNSRDNLFQNALEGTIGDAWNGIGLAERQQGFQNQQQQQAFEQALQRFMAGQTGGTGSASQAGYGSQVAGQGQDALTAFNEWMRNYGASAGTPSAPVTP
jgi:hypothetical protein